jgi:hypothetical protein
MEIRGREALGGFVKEHHVHYEIEPNVVVQGDRQEVVGYEVRLFATQGESKLPTPACRECYELLADLRSFAERLVGPGDAASWTGIVPAPRALYESSEVPGADEVALTMHVRCESPDHPQADWGGRRCMDEIRERLGEAGIPKR